MSRELAALKAQMQEMKNMMKVSFDLQLDIQRAIRQEVAAGLAAAMASNGKDFCCNWIDKVGLKQDIHTRAV